MSKIKIKLLSVILLSGSLFRLTGLNWDQNQHLHPDERFLTMVAGSLEWPKSFSQYLDSATSPLNPHNKNYSFYVYGTFPVILTKYIAESFKFGNYNGITLVGRLLSAIIDIGTVGLVYKIGKLISRNKKDAINISMLAAFFYAIAVLPIQLSHFFAVDTYLTFFLTLTFYFLIKIVSIPKKALNSLFLLLNSFLGIAFGLALSSKISAVYFLPIILLGFLYKLIKEKDILSIFSAAIIISFFTYLTLRLCYPYLFNYPNLLNLSLNPKVLANWKELKSFNDPKSLFPPGIQWLKTKPLIFPLKNLVYWGVGLPLGLLIITTTTYYLGYFFKTSIFFIKGIKSNIKNLFNVSSNYDRSFIIFLMLIWTIALFFYQGIQMTKAMRYIYPIYPFLALISASFIDELIQKKLINLKFILVLLFLLLIYPLSFITIYFRPHSRVAASEWIYNNIPPGSTITSESWDDALPLNFPGKIPQIYKSVNMPLYDSDNEEKWQKINTNLESVDYIILSSNRLYGSLMTVPEKFPQTNKFYQDLFDEKLGFKKVGEFTSRPNIPLPFIKLCLTPPGTRYGIAALKNQYCDLPGISFVDDYADETFTVYDHPKVIIFKNIRT